MKPEISVIIASDGRPDALKACIGSLQAQTPPEGPRWEAVIVERGTPTPGEVARDERIVLVAVGPIGLGAAWNAGMDRASGEYLIFMESSDTLAPGALHALRRAAEASTHSAVIGAFRVLGEHGEPLTRTGYPGEKVQAEWSRECISPPHAAIIARSTLGAHRFRADLHGAEWHDLALRLVHQGIAWAVVEDVVANLHLKPEPTMAEIRSLVSSSLEVCERACGGRDSAAVQERRMALALISVTGCSRSARGTLARRALERGPDVSACLDDLWLDETISAVPQAWGARDPASSAVRWWARLGLVGPAPDIIVEQIRITIAEAIGSEDRAPAMMVDQCPGGRPIVLLGMGRNARRIAGVLASRGLRVVGRDDGLTGPPPWAARDGIPVEMLPADAPWDPDAFYLMTPLHDDDFLRRVPVGLTVIRWRHALERITFEREQWLVEAGRMNEQVAPRVANAGVEPRTAARLGAEATNRIPVEVWYAIPTASERNCADTLPQWRARGYRIALLQDRSNRFDADADIIVAPFDSYRGYGASINHLIREVIPASASIVVTGGDDMFPEMGRTAAEIAEEFLQRFPDTFGVMQPIGDPYANTANVCGSPWIGREFARRVYGGSGPYCEEYFQLYEDQELHDVADRLGVLWKRPDLMHFHRHWRRERGAASRIPEYQERILSREHESRSIYERRSAAGFPGHEPLTKTRTEGPAGSERCRLIALMPAKNEAWIIGLSLNAALQWCDEVIVYDHASTDGTRGIIEEVSRGNPGRVHLIEGDEPAWNEMRIRQRLLDAARSRKADRVALIDADEILTANLLPAARECFARGCVPGFAMRLPMVSPWAGVERVRADGAFGGSLYAGFAASRGLEYAIPPDGYEMHGRIPGGLGDLEFSLKPFGGGGVMHMQFASIARLRAKAVWYKMTEVLRFNRHASAADLNRTYDWALAEPDETDPMPAAWWGPYRKLAEKYLHLHAEPWQLADIRRMLAEHGRERFAGIEFHGILDGMIGSARSRAA